MGIFDKIKNALFEEEYVEVEQKPKPIKKGVSPKKESSSKPIAKKVILPDKHDVKRDKIEDDDLEKVSKNNYVSDREVLKDTNDLKFPMMEDNDFRMDDNYSHYDAPKIVKVLDDEIENTHNRSSYNGSYSKNKVSDHSENKSNLYGGYKNDSVPSLEYGAYEKKEERTYFKPSPIISPIYGILDKNYKKDEIVSKREVRITSSYGRENLSVDDVRRKAYGSLSDDIANSDFDVEDQKVEDHEISDNLLVDLSDDNTKPKVGEVTLGDAEEYFQDLGLEYNIDYRDGSREFDNTEDVGRHGKIEDDTEIEVDSSTKSDMNDNFVDDDDSDDNLFDLIDSMYEKDN